VKRRKGSNNKNTSSRKEGVGKSKTGPDSIDRNNQPLGKRKESSLPQNYKGTERESRSWEDGGRGYRRLSLSETEPKEISSSLQPRPRTKSSRRSERAQSHEVVLRGGEQGTHREFEKATEEKHPSSLKKTAEGRQEERRIEKKGLGPAGVGRR